MRAATNSSIAPTDSMVPRRTISSQDGFPPSPTRFFELRARGDHEVLGRRFRGLPFRGGVCCLPSAITVAARTMPTNDVAVDHPVLPLIEETMAVAMSSRVGTCPQSNPTTCSCGHAFQVAVRGACRSEVMAK